MSEELREYVNDVKEGLSRRSVQWKNEKSLRKLRGDLFFNTD